MSLNRIVLTGRLTADPIAEQTPNGTTVCKVRIAADRAGELSDGAQQTGFFNVVSYDKGAEAAIEFLEKGSMVAVDGRVRYRTWTDKQTGQRREAVDIVGQLHFLSFKKSADAPTDEPEPVGVAAGDDIGF